uniref:ethanolamine kinase n=2 Tax=Hirondellea gigas TaxID=1518452 RepID=A0A6A7G5F4_9CRUS
MVLELPDVTVDGSSNTTLCNDAANVVTAIRTKWRKEDLMFQVYTEGITNKLVGVWHKDGLKDEQLLVRVYGYKTDLFIDRDAEKANIKFLHPYGCGPDLHCCFSNGLCYSFTPGVPVTPQSITQEDVCAATARQLAKMHSIPMKADQDQKPTLFTKLQRFLDLLPDFDSSERIKRVIKEGYTKTFIEQEKRSIQSVVDRLGCPIVLCHNDLLLGNVIWRQETDSINFIDFEYFAPNYQPYDIANHFCEFPGLDPVDYGRYPSEEFQRKWISRYLSHLPEQQRSLDWWVGAVAVLALASHLFWGTWSLLQAQHSHGDFDYAQYGIIRLDEYRRQKDQFLALSAKCSAE